MIRSRVVTEISAAFSTQSIGALRVNFLEVRGSAPSAHSPTSLNHSLFVV
jgi:hypothetical protein